MPRSRRRRRPESAADDSLDRLISGWKRTEIRRGTEWTVQPVAASQALKSYTCPGCGRSVEPGVAHVVAWRSDGVLGEAAAIADRRHWHTACWRIG